MPANRTQLAYSRRLIAVLKGSLCFYVRLVPCRNFSGSSHLFSTVQERSYVELGSCHFLFLCHAYIDLYGFMQYYLCINIVAFAYFLDIIFVYNDRAYDFLQSIIAYLFACAGISYLTNLILIILLDLG